ncbi:cellulose 1,4-beta-cellobiosidase [Streptomyces actinomycinicus]|uniref:Cellulose 1,4-beta-cellobiosidase n=1 Tax=Streptomyces actinomycinicus TaxID=1695166 RepID=A0A937ESQ3_9ACTN|nr:PA14 domain-containing protein [Streptomyces actinomycinicus]MBL1087481.1 cellulose 1,4-beta-cellobiosidase [Streptomyces actinomycinicus]
MIPARRTTATAVVLAASAALLSVVAPPASAAPACASPVYTRQFFANTTFSGTPKKTDCDSGIYEQWGTGAPATGLPKDNFGVRWTLTRDFGSGGPFSLAASAQDGIRVYLDGTRKVDLWKNVSRTQSKTVAVTVPPGRHTLRIDYVNWTGGADVSFGYAPRTGADVDKVKPLVPAGVSVTYDKATGQARLGWAKNKEMDLAGYRVYRRLKGKPFGAEPLATRTVTSYTDTALPQTGETYYYEVRAFDRSGNESAGTADQPVTTVDRTAPAVPVITGATGEVTAEGGTGGLEVAWDGVTGAVSYRVFRSPAENGTYTPLGSTDKLSYLDTSAAESAVYYYRVSAVDAAGNESARSAPQRGKIWDNDPPALVTGLTATPAEYGFHLNWDKNPATDLKYYTVHRGELVGDDGEQVCYGVSTQYVSPTETSYTYLMRPEGEEVCFFVDAVDDDGNSAIRWNGPAPAVITTELDMTPGVPTPENSPVRLNATAGEEGAGPVALGWNAVPGATGYRIYRWNPGTGAYEKLTDTTGTSYEDGGAPKGTTHFYWVTALQADGTESAAGGDWAVLAP